MLPNLSALALGRQEAPAEGGLFGKGAQEQKAKAAEGGRGRPRQRRRRPRRRRSGTKEAEKRAKVMAGFWAHS